MYLFKWTALGGTRLAALPSRIMGAGPIRGTYIIPTKGIVLQIAFWSGKFKNSTRIPELKLNMGLIASKVVDGSVRLVPRGGVGNPWGPRTPGPTPGGGLGALLLPYGGVESTGVYLTYPSFLKKWEKFSRKSKKRAEREKY